MIDNLSSGTLKNIRHHLDHANLTFYQYDIADFETVSPSFEGVQWVFHLAALADIVPSIEHPLKYHHSNIDGTVSVLEASRKANVQRMIYAASSSCYGIPDDHLTPETADIRPQCPYAVKKYLGEKYVLYWHQIYGLPVTSLRFSMFTVPVLEQQEPMALFLVCVCHKC